MHFVNDVTGSLSLVSYSGCGFL